jgi:microcystin degradation protein MlrC
LGLARCARDGMRPVSALVKVPLAVRGDVLRLVPPDRPALAVVRSAGVTLVLTAERRAFTTLSAFREAGIDPAAHRVVVVKLGYLFPDLRRVAARSILVLTPGWTDLRVEALPYARVPRPVYPLDRGTDWHAGPAP